MLDQVHLPSMMEWPGVQTMLYPNAVKKRDMKCSCETHNQITLFHLINSDVQVLVSS